MDKRSFRCSGLLNQEDGNMTRWWSGVEGWPQRGGARWPGLAQDLSCRLGRRKVEGRRRTGNVVAPTLCGQVNAEDLAGQGQRRAAQGSRTKYSRWPSQCSGSLLLSEAGHRRSRVQTTVYRRSGRRVAGTCSRSH